MTHKILASSKNLQTANTLREAGLYPFFRAIEKSDGSSVTVGNKRQVMIGSNNYLGMTHHPYVIEKAQEAIKKYGTGCTGSRFLNGNLTIHEELEESLAKFVGKEKAICFATGMQVNLGTISAICGPRDCILSDMENHASIIDATRLSLGTVYKYKHNDMAELSTLLEETTKKYRNVFIIADGVFSMTGDLMALPEIVALKRKYQNVWIYLDDAHGTGVMGERGRGTADHFNLTSETDLIMGTFSKSFASVGGFVAGDANAIDAIKHAARSFIFSAAMPPSAVATVQAVLDLVNQTDEFHKNLWDNVAFMQKGLNDLGFYTYGSKTPIIPILIGDDMTSMQVTKFLEDHGVFATPVIPPAVPTGESLIRTSYMASHKREDLQYCLDVFEKVKKSFNLPSMKERH